MSLSTASVTKCAGERPAPLLPERETVSPENCATGEGSGRLREMGPEAPGQSENRQGRIGGARPRESGRSAHIQPAHTADFPFGGEYRPVRQSARFVQFAAEPESVGVRRPGSVEISGFLEADGQGLGAQRVGEADGGGLQPEFRGPSPTKWSADSAALQ
jgi:hypothetical protein